MKKRTRGKILEIKMPFACKKIYKKKNMIAERYQIEMSSSK